MKKISLVEIKNDKNFIVDMMYACQNNMMQTNVYDKIGFGNRCFVHQDVYNLLENLRPILQKKGLKLKFKDAYRPPLAFKIMKEIIPMPGFFASSVEKSQHCYATAIDVILTDLSGHDLDFPCQVDAYDYQLSKQVLKGNMNEFIKHLEKAKYSWSDSNNLKAIQNRDMFRNIMEQVGFKALEHEWWHFNLPNNEEYSVVNLDITSNGDFIFYY